jgi:hypothetical protein
MPGRCDHRWIGGAVPDVLRHPFYRLLGGQVRVIQRCLETFDMDWEGSHL